MRPPSAPTITRILEDSPAARLGLQPGERLVCVNGSVPRDLIDYDFLCAGEEQLALELLNPQGHTRQVLLTKELDEDPGIEFETALFDGLLQCNNGCSFCFIDQQPEGLRPTLYLKDDDYRLSFLYGSYLTLTNLPPPEWERIRRLRLSPLYVSVHATEPELRARILKNPRGALIREHLQWFKDNRLQVHAQVVLCPDLNDGDHLEQTLTDLASYFPAVASVAVVPVGLTHYRPDQDDMRIVTPAKAQEVLAQVTRRQREFRRTLGTTLVWLADEWYLLTGKPLPSSAHYEDYQQIGNGVGSLRLFLQQFARAQKRLPPSLPRPLQLHWVVGMAVAEVFAPVVARFKAIAGLTLELVPIESTFWGERITVTGLLTGSDVLVGLKDRPLGDGVLLPALMLKDGEEFLDSVTLTQVRAALAAPVYVVPSQAEALVDWVLALAHRESFVSHPARSNPTDDSREFISGSGSA
ncbi:TIGR03279 family radical SAM protein [Anthocerotibacter panamensis]|uniref:TIGR03279 family radical SAM protein n=1 Tax=Anthocerotibacter panamensis TaxID=2857077 RepID=UPI001C408CB7|nr:TIGR03279 family radical SAM protein [Anthocerotibacter panamensis]